MARTPDDEETVLLIELATDATTDSGARVLAADRLAQIGGPAAVDALDRMAHVAGLSMYTDSAIVNLGRLGGPAATSILAGIASDPASPPNDRFFAAEILVSSDPDIAIDVLVDIALDPEVILLLRTKALSLLGSFADFGT